MPAQRLTDDSISISKSDIVGCDADGESGFVRHVALSDNDQTGIKSDDTVTVNHMGPPLELNAEFQIHVHGCLKLTDDELKKIELFIDEYTEEQKAQSQRSMCDDYIIMPHTALSPDKSFRRFSCVGYVIEAYREAGIEILKRDTPPKVELSTLKIPYPILEKMKRKTKERFGLKGDGPWPVLLPGYVFHSLKRTPEEICKTPYEPQIGDEFFP